MNPLRWSLTLCLALSTLPVSGSAHARGEGPQLDQAEELEAQPRMRAALVNLQAAKRQLQKASHDKGGHRVKAIVHVNVAIRQVRKGIAFDNANARSIEDAVPAAAERQPRMAAAVKLLLRAKSQLHKASRDKGGHRVKAIAAINAALSETRKGIDFDNRH